MPLVKYSTEFLPWTDLTEGWVSRIDSPKASGLSIMKNAYLTDRGGIANRPGIELFGVADSSGNPVTSLYSAMRRDGTRILIRASGTKLQYFNTYTQAWELLKDGYTSGQQFGFQCFNVNTDMVDYVYFCNAVEPYARWTMFFDALTAPLAAIDTALHIHSTLTQDIHYQGASSVVTTTTVQVAGTPWANDIWKNFYVHITSGANAGQIALISGNTNNTLTFATLTGLTGTPTFEIRLLRIAASGTVNVGATPIAYSAVPTDTTLTITPGSTALSGTAVTAVPVEFPGCPRGNILQTYFSMMLVAGVKANPTTLYRSKLLDATDFSFSSPRTAGQGDRIDFPEDGEPIRDISVREDKIEIIKDSVIYDLIFTQDAADLPNKTLRLYSPLIGTQGQSFRLGDEIAWVTKSNEVTQLSRIALRDQQPQRANIAWTIKRGIRNFDFSSARGKTFRNYTPIAAKQSNESTTNDKIIMYDNAWQKWIGEWDIPASDFAVHVNAGADGLYLGSAASNEVYRMLTTGTSIVKGDDIGAVDMKCETQWVNKTQDQMSNQQFNIIAVTGYIRRNTPITFKLWYDFADEPEHTWIFNPLNPTVLAYNILGGFAEEVMGMTSIGVTPLGFELSSDEETPDHDEMRFLVYFGVPWKDNVWAKLGWETSGTEQYVEITEIRSNFMESKAQVSQKRFISFEKSS